tara:strand:+ start:2245 stop:2568 length:324 start_codon:yes stop_codon:yes gene_type:complete
MNRILACLFLALVAAQSVNAAEPQAADYTLSMAGALINDHCGRSWQNAEYVNVHACNYQLANVYTLEISSAHFGECTVLARGDIVMIADCMVARFNTWLGENEEKIN